ncbi:hypothetical protein Patl1_22173 [Pistacia atlantica]|uniref:Uncharacterized protein n=1 Tax=Pistacia atlantica TaxID=434234 RepID=A0ACC1BIB5_9ROSI|nr:hypothetical protein Patl1_22173 [Pistacia atlantica]
MVFTSFTYRVVVIWATILTCLVAINSSELSAIQLEKEALLNSTWWSKSSMTNNASDHCEWDGIFCNSAGSITEIYLFGHEIRRELGQFNFSCFPNLEYLDLGSNNLSGRIPSQIGALSKLKTLYLNGNDLTGELGQFNFSCFPNLEYLLLGGNKLSGRIPSQIGALSKLRVLSLGMNDLTGELMLFVSACCPFK